LSQADGATTADVLKLSTMHPFSQWILIFSHCIITIIKTTDEFRNVGDAALGRDAYAMSHLSAEACTQRLAAARGDGYRLAAAVAAIARVWHRQWSYLLNVNMTTNCTNSRFICSA